MIISRAASSEHENGLHLVLALGLSDASALG